LNRFDTLWKNQNHSSRATSDHELPENFTKLNGGIRVFRGQGGALLPRPLVKLLGFLHPPRRKLKVKWSSTLRLWGEKIPCGERPLSGRRKTWVWKGSSARGTSRALGGIAGAEENGSNQKPKKNPKKNKAGRWKVILDTQNSLSGKGMPSLNQTRPSFFAGTKTLSNAKRKYNLTLPRELAPI